MKHKFVTILQIILFILSIGCFLTALPLDGWSGDGRGFIAKATPFKGYELVLLSIVFPILGWGTITAANLLVVVAPILCVFYHSIRSNVFRILMAIWGVMSAAAIPIALSWEGGCYVGAWLWGLAVGLACMGTLVTVVQKPKLEG